MFKKCKVSCQNLFLIKIRGRESQQHLTLQEGRKIPICGRFFNFRAVGLNMEINSKSPHPPIPQIGDISSLFLPKFYSQNGIAKMVDFFNFGSTRICKLGPSSERKGKISVLFLPKFY